MRHGRAGPRDAPAPDAGRSGTVGLRSPSPSLQFARRREARMSATIIVTGAALAAPAQDVAARRRARLLTIRPYTPPADIAALAEAEHAEAIIVRAAHIT